MQITFGKTAKGFILDSFGKATNKEGYLVEKGNLNQRVLTRDGQEITEEEFGGIISGSTIFVKNDLPTIMELSDSLKPSDGHSK